MTVKYLVRLIVFIAKKAVAVLLVLGLLTTAFTSAMNLSNMFILLSDGMEYRANAILGARDKTEMVKYFSQEFIDNDEDLYKQPYENHRMSGSSYSLRIKSLWAWPWQTSCNAVVEERVILEGYLKNEHKTQEQIDNKEEIPAPLWENRELRVTLRKQSDGSWIITRMQTIEDLPAATARPRL
jgi:hypothetical protein